MEPVSASPYHKRMKPTYFAPKRSILLALALLFLPAQASNDLPDLGDSALSNLPINEERRIADMVTRELRKSGELLDDIEVADYLDRLGYKLVAAGNDTRVGFRFFPLRSRQINAWAVPGGVVGINVGLIVLSQHESELAAVMAHEIAHVTQHHYARMVESQKGSSVASLGALAVAILAGRNSPDAAQAAIAASQGVMAQRYLDFSRDFEREADRVGMQTLEAAGFDTRAMPTFFDRMQRFYRSVDNGAFAFLRTHPVTSERIADSTARADQQPYKQWPDSREYLMVREKARVIQLGATEAVTYFANTAREKKFADANAHAYGYAYAQLQAGQLDAAWTTLQEVRNRLDKPDAMVEVLAGQIRLEQGRFAEAAAIYKQARAAFPAAPALAYGEIDLALRQGKYRDALTLTQAALLARSTDAGLFKRQADAYTQLNNEFGAHRALGDYHAALDEPSKALEQFEIAKKVGGDFYQMSALEARMKALRLQIDQAEGKKKGGSAGRDKDGGRNDEDRKNAERFAQKGH